MDGVEEFIRDIEDYYGSYKAQHRDIVKQYVRKRYLESQLPLLKKYLYENLHANYGAPTVSGFKKAERTAYSEDGMAFTKPNKKREGQPMWKCKGCDKLSPMESHNCVYCGEATTGNGKVVVPKGYFD